MPKRRVNRRRTAGPGKVRHSPGDDWRLPGGGAAHLVHLPVLLAAHLRDHGEQCREQCPVCPVQGRAARLLPLQDGELWRRIKISAVFDVS